MFRRKAEPLPADTQTIELIARVNDLEGQLIRMNEVLKVLQKRTTAQDVLAPHIATLSVQIRQFSEAFDQVDAVKRDLLGAIDVAQVLMRNL